MPTTIRRIFIIAVALLAGSASAATHVWTGTSSDLFSDSGNWTGGSPAGDPQADLTFSSSSPRLSPINDIAGLTVRSMTFENGYTISGNAITLTGGTMTGTAIIATPLVLQGNATFESTSLHLSGSISGSGDLTIDGTAWIEGRTSNTHTGTTFVTGGTLTLQKSANTTAIAGPLHLTSGVVEVRAAEQIDDDAPIHIAAGTELRVFKREDLGPIELHGRLYSDNFDDPTVVQTAHLTGDIVAVGSSANTPAVIQGVVWFDVPIEIDVTGHLQFFDPDVRSTAGGAVTFTGTGTVTQTMFRTLSYSAPTTINGPAVRLDIPNSPVRLLSGTFDGDAYSLKAEAGTLIASTEFERNVFTTSIDLDAPSAVRFILGGATSLSDPVIKMNGTLDLGGAQAIFEDAIGDPITGTHILISNLSSSPVTGTFDGLPEGTVLYGTHRITYQGGDGNDVVLEELPKQQVSLVVTQTPNPGVAFEPLTLKVDIVPQTPGHNATGFVRFQFRSTSPALEHAPVSGNHAEASFAYPPGTHTAIITYLGDSQTEEASTQYIVEIDRPAATITSIDPSTVQNGSGVVVIRIHGENFAPGDQVLQDGEVLRPTTYISYFELRYSVELNGTAATEIELAVRHPEAEGGLTSNAVTLTVTAAPEDPEQPFVFGSSSVRGFVDPNGSGSWLSVAAKGNARIVSAAIVEDENGDGAIEVPRDPAATGGLWTMVDMTTGEIDAATPDGAATPLAFPAEAIVRGPSGTLSWLVLPVETQWEVMWVRPGVGAWSGSIGDVVAAGHAFLDVRTLQSLNAVAAPAGFEAGDVLIAINRSDFTFYATEIDEYLDDAIGGGRVRIDRQEGYSVTEGATVRIAVARLGGGDGTVTVQYTASFADAAGTLTFGPGELLKYLDLPIADDAIYEGNRTGAFVLSNPAGTTISGAASVPVTILENDGVPQITIDDVTVEEGDSGRRDVVVPVRLSQAGGGASVMWTLDSGAPGDWQPRGGTVVFAAGESEQTITLSYTADTIPANGQQVTIALSSPVNAVVADGSATIVVNDDDAVRVFVTNVDVIESRRDAEIQLTLAETSDQAIAIDWFTSPDSAVAGSDFTADSGTVTIPAGSTTATIRVTIVDDAIAESTEAFQVNLASANANLERSRVRVRIFDDDDAFPGLLVSDVTLKEGDRGLTVVPLTLQLTRESDTPVEVHYSTAAVTAGASDFVETIGTITFAPGELTKLVELQVRGDVTREQDETFQVIFTSVSGAVHDGSPATITIRDDEGKRRAARH